MFKKLYDRLLTHHPLTWNTRVVWVLSVIFILHLFFFLAGFAEINAGFLKEYYSLSDVLTSGILTFSILCSLALIIIWLVFYLRNNAYKSFYIIDKWHLIKEFFIILIILFFSIIFFESYRLGAWTKTRTITSKQQLVKEANTLNLATAFIPRSKSDYFKLVDCDIESHLRIRFQEAVNYFDSTYTDYYTENSAMIRKALLEKDAFSYKNYCDEFITLEEYQGFAKDKQWRDQKNRWIDNHNTDSIRQVLNECIAICKKYNIEQHLDPEELTQLVFADSFNNVTRIFSPRISDYANQVEYFDGADLNRALRFVDECYYNPDEDGTMLFLTIEMYIAIGLCILLLCYRLFSRRVFLISAVGTIVWCIIFALVGISSGDGNAIGWFYILLFTTFTILIIGLLSGANKTVNGVLLNWHIYMLPFLALIIMLIIQENYYDRVYGYRYGSYQTIPKEVLKERYPIGYWVTQNGELISRLNLLFVILYIPFVYTRLAKKWHIMPEE